MQTQIKQLVIVCRKQELQYGNLMVNLMSEYFEYKVFLWDEKVWNDNKAMVTASHKVVFLGDYDITQEHSSGVVWRYDEYDMKYGWLGNQCIIIAKPLAINKGKGFHKYYKDKSEQFENAAEELSNSIGSKVAKVGAIVGWFAPFGIPILIASGVKLASDRAKLVKYQYELLVREFVLNGGLKQFMGD